MESHLSIHVPNHQPECMEEYMDILGLEHQWFSCRFSMGFQVFLQVFDWKILGTSFQGPRQVLQQHLVAQPLKVTCELDGRKPMPRTTIRLTNSVYTYIYIYVCDMGTYIYIYMIIYICTVCMWVYIYILHKPDFNDKKHI